MKDREFSIRNLLKRGDDRINKEAERLGTDFA